MIRPLLAPPLIVLLVLLVGCSGSVTVRHTVHHRHHPHCRCPHEKHSRCYIDIHHPRCLCPWEAHARCILPGHHHPRCIHRHCGHTGHCVVPGISVHVHHGRARPHHPPRKKRVVHVEPGRKYVPPKPRKKVIHVEPGRKYTPTPKRKKIIVKEPSRRYQKDNEKNQKRKKAGSKRKDEKSSSYRR